MATRGKALAILRDNYGLLSLPEFASFLRHALFKDEKILVYGLSLQEGGVEVPGTLAGIVAKGQPADLAAARLQRHPIPWELLCDRYDGVSDFFVYRENDEVGHVSWLYYKGDPNRILRLGEGECEIKFCLTFSEHRGKGIYPAVLRSIQRYLKDRGLTRCFICVRHDNTPSIRGIEKAGFRPVGTVRLRKAFGVQLGRPRRPQEL